MAEARRLDAGEVIVSRDELQRVRDLVFRLEAALDDANTDLSDGSDLAAVYRMVVAAARAVVDAPLEPLATYD